MVHKSQVLLVRTEQPIFFAKAEAMCNGALSLQIINEALLIIDGRSERVIFSRMSMQFGNLLSLWFPYDDYFPL